jgi:hypothetical protein
MANAYPLFIIIFISYKTFLILVQLNNRLSAWTRVGRTINILGNGQHQQQDYAETHHKNIRKNASTVQIITRNVVHCGISTVHIRLTLSQGCYMHVYP